VENVAEYPEDLQLVQRLLAGNEKEFARVFRENYPRLYRFAFARLNGDADAADEMAQRTLCRAVRKLHLYRAEASLFTWLCQICRHEIYDLVESRERHGRYVVSADDDPEVRAVLESLPADGRSDPSGGVQRAELLRFVQMVLDYLPPQYTEVLRWKYVEDLGVDEIATRLNVSTHAAESMLARARRSFKESWRSVTGETLPDTPLMEIAP
jgi:RNA polymerase sigma-70 factor, ECF subfamily